MLEGLQGWVDGAPSVLQWLAIMAASTIPFVESYFGSVIGVLAGVSPVVAILAAVVGNVGSMIVFVAVAASARAKAGVGAKPLSPRRERLKRSFDRWGVPGVSLLGQTVLPSQITSAAMVGFGASQRQVIVWQIVSIVMWGVVFGALAAVGVTALTA